MSEFSKGDDPNRPESLANLNTTAGDIVSLNDEQVRELLNRRAEDEPVDGQTERPGYLMLVNPDDLKFELRRH